ncbi:hypothetical protein ACHAWF_000289 [Thalassiosira exigua]
MTNQTRRAIACIDSTTRRKITTPLGSLSTASRICVMTAANRRKACAKASGTPGTRCPSSSVNERRPSVAMAQRSSAKRRTSYLSSQGSVSSVDGMRGAARGRGRWTMRMQAGADGRSDKMMGRSWIVGCVPRAETMMGRLGGRCAGATGGLGRGLSGARSGWLLAGAGRWTEGE